MKYRRLGKTGLKVSVVGLGTWQLGGEWGKTFEQAEVDAMVDRAAELGINLIDTAECYGDHLSERLIGQAIKGRRDQWIVATKFGHRFKRRFERDDVYEPALVRGQLEASLEALQTDYIDLYQTHSDDRDTPLDETLRALDDMVRSGKVRYIGASNIQAWRLCGALWTSEKHSIARYDSLQPHYNLAHRAEFERELKPLVENQGVAVIPYSPLAAGFLTGKYQRGAETAGARADNIRNRYFNERGWAILDKLQEVAGGRGLSPAQAALAWLLTQPVITAPIIGANSVKQLNESLGAAGVRLSAEEMAALNDASKWE